MAVPIGHEIPMTASPSKLDQLRDLSVVVADTGDADAIARLKPAWRDTVVLVVGQQLTHGEAAEILGVSEATVSWRMHEVRKVLAPRHSDDT